MTSRRMRGERHVPRTGEMKKARDILVGKSEGKNLLRIPKHNFNDYITMDQRQVVRL